MRPIRWAGLALILATVSGSVYLCYSAMLGQFAPMNVPTADDLNKATACFFGLTALVMSGVTYPLLQSSKPIKVLGSILVYVTAGTIAIGAVEVHSHGLPVTAYLVVIGFWLLCLSLCAMDVRRTNHAMC